MGTNLLIFEGDAWKLLIFEVGVVRNSGDGVSERGFCVYGNELLTCDVAVGERDLINVFVAIGSKVEKRITVDGQKIAVAAKWGVPVVLIDDAEVTIGLRVEVRYKNGEAFGLEGGVGLIRGIGGDIVKCECLCVSGEGERKQCEGCTEQCEGSGHNGFSMCCG